MQATGHEIGALRFAVCNSEMRDRGKRETSHGLDKRNLTGKPSNVESYEMPSWMAPGNRPNNTCEVALPSDTTLALSVQTSPQDSKLNLTG